MSKHSPFMEKLVKPGQRALVLMFDASGCLRLHACCRPNLGNLLHVQIHFLTVFKSLVFVTNFFLFDCDEFICSNTLFESLMWKPSPFEGFLFMEKSKLRYVGTCFMDMASKRWLAQILQCKLARTWKQFKAQFCKQSLPLDFEKDVCEVWDWISKKQGETVTQYVNEF